MKNTVFYKDLPSPIFKKANEIPVDKLLYLIKKEEAQQKVIPFTLNGFDTSLVDSVKTYLNQDKFRELVKDAFGNEQKKQALLETIKNFISKKNITNAYSHVLKDYTLEEAAQYITEEIAGLSVITRLITPTITDIKIFAWNNIWVDDYRTGFYKTDASFDSHEDYEALCKRFVNASGVNWSQTNPKVSAQFPQMRVNIVGYDINPKISTAIRIVSKDLRLSENYMLSTGYANKDMIHFLQNIMCARQSILISGITGSGKTELLRYLVGFINPTEVAIMIEDTPETFLPELYPNHAIDSWKTRTGSDSNKAIGYGELIPEALRQDPDWIMLQESRAAEETFEVVKAGETGHTGATTLHSSSAIDSITRMVNLCQEKIYKTEEYYGKLVSKVFNIGIHIERIDAVRKITQIVEYVGYQDNNPIVNVLFEYDYLSGEHVKKDQMSKRLKEAFLKRGISYEWDSEPSRMLV